MTATFESDINSEEKKENDYLIPSMKIITKGLIEVLDENQIDIIKYFKGEQTGIELYKFFSERFPQLKPKQIGYLVNPEILSSIQELLNQYSNDENIFEETKGQICENVLERLKELTSESSIK